MVKLRKPGSFLIFCIVIALTFAAVFPSRIWGEVQPVTEVQEKLKGISDKEKGILEDLFTLSQEIEEMDRQETEFSQRIDTLKVGIKDLENRIEDRQKEYDDQREVLRQVLVSYQRNGPASYLERILTSKDLTTFLRSLNIIKDLSRNVGDLLDSLETGKKQLASEKENLAGKMVLLEDQQKELQKAKAKKLQLKGDQETYLDSLEEERGYYQEQLENVQQMWGEIKAFFSDISQAFIELMEEENLFSEALELHFEFPLIKGTLDEKTVNDMLKEHSDLAGMEFHFHPGKAVLEIPEKQLSLEETFSIQEKKALRFEVEKGSFYKMPLEPASIQELFRDGYWLIDFKDMLGGSDLKSIEIMEGHVEFKMTASLG